MSLTRVTTKGQVTIPHTIRSKMDIKSGDAVIFVMEGSRIVLVPIKRKKLSQFRGVFHVTEPIVDFDEAQRIYREAITRHVLDVHGND